MTRIGQLLGRGLLLGLVVSGLPHLHAAPLTWFAAPGLNAPRSSAATVVTTSGSILLLGGSPAGSISVLHLGGANLPPIDTTRIAPGAVALANGLIVVYGGKESSASDSVTSSAIGYDSTGATDEDPVSIPGMSTPRYDLAYAGDSAGGGYAIGGVSSRNQALASVERNDAGTNGWTARASLPEARYRFPAVFDGSNSIYTFGGRTNTVAGTETTSVLRYTISSDSWSAVASMPVATAGSAAVLGPDGEIYVIGGTTDGVVTNLVQVYDPGSDSWTVRTPLPSAITAAGAAVDGLGRLVVMGGLDGTNNSVATVWQSQRLNVPDSPPVFGSIPVTRATYQTLYSYTASATGNPQPTYSLVSGPAGMQIDNYSGLVSWTPLADQLGTNPVMIAAINFAGSATQTFNITAIGPPPSTPGGFAVTAINDTSVTLSWEASSGGIGPITYHLYRQRVVVQPKGGSRLVTVSLINGITDTSITLGGLVMGSSYRYLLTAVASGAESAPTPVAFVKTSSPQNPLNLRVAGLASTTVTLAWDASPGPAENPGYSAITSYSLFERISSVNVLKVTGITGNSVTVSGLLPGSSHLWLVRAFDAAGNGSGGLAITAANPMPASALLSAPTLSASGGIQFTVQQSGPTIQTVLIQASTNLLDPSAWVEIGSVLPANGAFTFTDPNAAQFPVRFYRVVSP